MRRAHPPMLTLRNFDAPQKMNTASINWQFVVKWNREGLLNINPIDKYSAQIVLTPQGRRKIEEDGS